MNTALQYLGIAALLAMRQQATSKGLPRTRVEFAETFQQRYNWQIEPEQIEQALRQVEAWGYLTITTDRYAGESLQFTKLSAEVTLYQNLPENVDVLYNLARQNGVPWVRDVFGNAQFWVDLEQEGLSNISLNNQEIVEADKLDDFSIPASDRVVSLSDNRPEVELLSADLRGIAEQVRENNEAAIELGSEKELIEGELRAAEVLVSQPIFRLQRLLFLILPALRFLAEKFATGAIGEMAKRLIAALIGLA